MFAIPARFSFVRCVYKDLFAHVLKMIAYFVNCEFLIRSLNFSQEMCLFRKGTTMSDMIKFYDFFFQI